MPQLRIRLTDTRCAQKLPAPQISNVGFHDVHGSALVDAVAADTLFIHGSASSGGSRHNTANFPERPMPPAGVACTAACRYRQSPSVQIGVSTVCDRLCSESPNTRLGCGAADKATFGDACRVCYNDVAVARAVHLDRTLGRAPQDSDEYVIMCNTRQPPDAEDCPTECSKKSDTVRFDISASAPGYIVSCSSGVFPAKT